MKLYKVDWVSAPDLRFGDVALLAVREGSLSSTEFKETGVSETKDKA